MSAVRTSRSLFAGLFAGVAVALGIVAPTSLAHAEGTTGVIVESYVTASGCPAEDAFREQVQRRARRPMNDAPTLKVSVHVAREGNEVTGSIVVTDVHGERSSRQVKANRCDDVVSALALVAALAVDDAVRKEEEKHAEESSEPVPRDEGVLAPRPPPVSERIPSRSAPTIGRSPRLRLGAQAAAQGGVTPDVMMTVPISIALAFEARSDSPDLEAVLDPSLRLAGVFGGADRTVVGTAAAQFRWTAGPVDVCVLRIRAGALGVAPCGRLELGVLSAAGEQIIDARRESRTWTAIALPVTFRAELGSHIFVELEAAPRLPLVRDRFVFQPNATIFQAPGLGWTGALGAGVTIP